MNEGYPQNPLKLIPDFINDSMVFPDFNIKKKYRSL